MKFMSHSARKAMIGSTLVARRAGNHAAMNATAETRITMATNVTGSEAPTPKSSCHKRVAAKAPAGHTILMPTSAWPATRAEKRTSPPQRVANSISLVRCATE